VASWCKAHNIEKLDNMLISNKAIDMDSPTASAQIIKAVRELTTEDAVQVTIDTVNNHMSGNENDAKDTRNMLNAVQIVGRALNSGMTLVHHTGNAIEAKNRARGSSAWKASMDSQILVSKKDGLIEVTCTKMKDTEEPQPFFGKLQSVALGWVDEDGEEIKGAVFQIENDVPQQKQKGESEYAKDIRKFTNACWHSKAEEFNGSPYLSRSALINYLINNEGLSEATAKTYAQASKQGRLIYNLLTSQIIQAQDHGWVVSDNLTASSMMLSKALK
jgi:hypothetical protein